MTQNRYYSNLAQATFIANTNGLGVSDTALQVTANQDWPTAFPFALWLEPNTTNSEVVLVTSGSGTAVSPYVIQRGYDGTIAYAHAVGAVVTPGVIELDLAEPQSHLNLTGSASGAHGLPASAWLGGQMQLIDTQTALFAQAAFTFSSTVFSTIPSSANHLLVMAQASSASNDITDQILVQYNGYSGAFYVDQYLMNVTTTTSSGSATSNSSSSGITNFWHLDATHAVCGIMIGPFDGLGYTGLCEIVFPNFKNSSTGMPRTHNFKSGASTNTGNFAVTSTGTGSCVNVTSPITSLTFTNQSGGNFNAGSVFQLYAF